MTNKSQVTDINTKNDMRTVREITARMLAGHQLDNLIKFVESKIAIRRREAKITRWENDKSMKSLLPAARKRLEKEKLVLRKAAKRIVEVDKLLIDLKDNRWIPDQQLKELAGIFREIEVS